MLVIEPPPRRPIPRESFISRHLGSLIVAISCLALLASYLWWLDRSPPFVLARIRNHQWVPEGRPISIRLDTEWRQWSAKPLQYSIISGPPAARIDPRTNCWEWTPDEASGGRRIPVRLHCNVHGRPDQQADCEFFIDVHEMVQTPVITPIPEQTVEVGKTLAVDIQARDADLPRQPLKYSFGRLSPPGAEIDPISGRLTWTPPTDPQANGVYTVQVTASKVFHQQLSASTVTFTVHVQAASEKMSQDDRAVDENPSQRSSDHPRPEAVAPAPGIRAGQNQRNDHFYEELAQMTRAGKLCDPAQYTQVRRLFAKRFAQDHAAELNAAFQGSGAYLGRWLEAHPDQRDELYTALEPTDDVVAALKIIERLLTRSFQRLTADFELAIATAVTWDRESGIYDYTTHQRRSHATVAREKTADALANFEYYSDPDFAGQRRIRKLPWEFLKHVVNHRTPLEERAWVARTYHDPRRPIGLCYEDVAYDHQMIKSGETTSNLAPRAYTLANLKDRGGICVMQADYATRVAKCLGIPAAYVEGRARTGGNHAWVMWTELQPANSSGLAFSLESHGRFFLDRYYVGQLLEPQSGRLMTDRELELRLQGVGLNPLAYRQAKLILQAWPELQTHLKMTAEQELDLLDSVIALSPGHQAVWQAVAQLTRSGRVTPELNKRLDGLRDRCIKTFTNCPDFICQIIDDLLAYEPDLSRRLPTYDRLLQLWASTGRPDLTCRLRLQLTTQLTADKQYSAALGGLAQTIKRFPDEGRYVPQLIDKYEAIAQHVEDGPSKVLKLYQELLPLIPRRRQSQTSPFYLEMLARAAQRFAQAGETKPAQAYADQLKKLKGK